MSSPDMVLDVLRAELRAAGITYKMLADRIAMSESSIKRMFGQKDMTLSRLAQICQAAGIAWKTCCAARPMPGRRPTPSPCPGNLAGRQSAPAADGDLLPRALEPGADGRNLPPDRTRMHRPAGRTRPARPDRTETAEPLQLRVSNAFRWLPDGPVQRYFREHVVEDYFAGRFDGPAKR
jgi:DNA-binding Xre family transcriptional regulator